MIDKFKIKLSTFSAELPEKLDPNLRTLITTEAEIYEVARSDQHDGTFDQIYRSKVVGTTIVKQAGEKPKTIIAKSKRTQSQRLRAAIWALNPDEEYYERLTNVIIENIEEISNKYL